MTHRLGRIFATLTAVTVICFVPERTVHGQPAVPVTLEFVGVMLMPVDGKSLVGVGLANRSDQSIWVDVSLDADGRVQCGSSRAELPANVTRWYACPVKPVIARHDYPIRVDIYLDGQESEIAGVRETEARFSKRDVQWLKSRL